MSGHILKSFDRDLDEVTKLVYTMGTTVSSQLEKAGKALIKLDVALAEEVRDGDAIVNGQHVEVDAQVENQIAIRQPQAVDLRRLLGCSSASTLNAWATKRATSRARSCALRNNPPRAFSPTVRRS